MAKLIDHQSIIDRIKNKKDEENQEYNERKLNSCRVLTEKMYGLLSNPNSDIKIPTFFRPLSSIKPSEDNKISNHFMRNGNHYYYTGCDEFSKLMKEVNKSDKKIYLSNYNKKERWHNVNNLSIRISTDDKKIEYILGNSSGCNINYDEKNKAKDSSEPSYIDF